MTDEQSEPIVVNAEGVALETLIDLAENAEDEGTRLSAAATLLMHARDGA